ncbi:2,3-diaminopropionate biosynthesis protein SbnA [Herbidospora galbida]|uniref:2,3-diaminopropionate biosynthesis protein SbnA n=1 Tax=Herbidospora galbida TaxID=2575442 RepID=A0A4U3MDI6_9ACTN|nr:2,3-diaminopropionate biosynthesis protein SbnA [Herbidospora galbida]TKK87245.1 2,3-diaminopropionate biosynthesis protein SbnA [Herbidospora galbida]
MQTAPDGILAAIGETPLIRLDRLFPDSPVTFYGKLEGQNPGGSSKDRAALSMTLDAITTGAIVPGHTVLIESSSGNLGIALAQICRRLGIRFVCVVDPKTTTQNLALLAAYGAEVDLVTDSENGDYLPARLRRVQELLARHPHTFWTNQYANPLNAHAQESIMREVVAQLGGVPPDYMFIATGTCGTIHGCRSYSRRNGLPTRVVAVDAEGSAIFGHPRRPRLIPGHGAAIRPPLHHDDIADEVVHVGDQDCVVGCRTLATTEAILCGGSSGAVVSAADARRGRLPAGSTCVLVLPDRGERYLDTIYSDPWVNDQFGEIMHLWKRKTSC